MLSIKALHIIAVVVWFSGLFYIGRLFVYHQEANQRAEAEQQVLKPQFALMEKRLWYAITWPGMIATVITRRTSFVLYRNTRVDSCQTVPGCRLVGISWGMWSIETTIIE